MEPNYIISCCSTADLTPARFADRSIAWVPFHFFLDGVEYPDDLGQSIPFDRFYQAMVDGADTRTSQVNMEEYIAHFTPFLEAGRDVLHVCLSSGISGTMNSALAAKAALEERFPERKLYILDSLLASSGYGLLLDKLADLRDGGMGIDELRDWTEANKLRFHAWFFSSDLTFYIKGGRISKAAGMVGSLLGICPLLNMSADGKLTPREKIRSKKKVIQTIVERMKENAEGGPDYSGKCFICHSACYEDARAVADLVEAAFPKLNGKAEIFSVGTTIGSHTGPGTVALFFEGSPRTE